VAQMRKREHAEACKSCIDAGPSHKRGRSSVESPQDTPPHLTGPSPSLDKARTLTGLSTPSASLVGSTAPLSPVAPVESAVQLRRRPLALEDLPTSLVALLVDFCPAKTLAALHVAQREFVQLVTSKVVSKIRQSYLQRNLMTAFCSSGLWWRQWWQQPKAAVPHVPPVSAFSTALSVLKGTVAATGSLSSFSSPSLSPSSAAAAGSSSPRCRTLTSTSASSSPFSSPSFPRISHSGTLSNSRHQVFPQAFPFFDPTVVEDADLCAKRLSGALSGPAGRSQSRWSGVGSSASVESPGVGTLFSSSSGLASMPPSPLALGSTPGAVRVPSTTQRCTPQSASTTPPKPGHTVPTRRALIPSQPRYWLRELHAWEVAIHVPRDRPSVGTALRDAPPGAHIILSAGMHVMTETVMVDKHVNIVGQMNSWGKPLSVLKHNQSLIRVGRGGVLGLCGVAVWCHASDQQRRATITIESEGCLHTKQVEIKCISGRYSSGVQVYKGGNLLMQHSAVRCCTGSGVIIFGKGLIHDSILADNSFNGVEVQKGAVGQLLDCHIHSNGYSNNEDDLGSGVTVYGEHSSACLERCCVHSNKGGGVLIHSNATGELYDSEISMNHAGFEFGDVDVDTNSEARLVRCRLVGNGEHGREQYRVLAVQQGARLHLSECDIQCSASAFGTGIEVQRAANVDMDRCSIHGCTGSGVLLRDPDTSARIAHSRLFDNDLHGLEVQAGTIYVLDSQIEENRVHDVYISETNGECSANLVNTKPQKVFWKKAGHRHHTARSSSAGGRGRGN